MYNKISCKFLYYIPNWNRKEMFEMRGPMFTAQQRVQLNHAGVKSTKPELLTLTRGNVLGWQNYGPAVQANKSHLHTTHVSRQAGSSSCHHVRRTAYKTGEFNARIRHELRDWPKHRKHLPLPQIFQVKNLPLDYVYPKIPDTAEKFDVCSSAAQSNIHD